MGEERCGTIIIIVISELEIPRNYCGHIFSQYVNFEILGVSNNISLSRATAHYCMKKKKNEQLYL